jgi:hypothetical protein
MRTLGRLAVITVAGIAGCDAQHGPDYEGEPLLTIQGSITRVDGERLDSALVPAIAWADEWGATLFLQDVHAEGDFPASFRFSVLQPPPAAAIFASLDGLRFAFGSIIAAQPNHPAVAEGSSFQSVFGEVCRGEMACAQTRSWCASADRCYVEEVVCEPGQFGDDCTVVSSEGNPALKDNPWAEHVEGFSENFSVLYAQDFMPADSLAAGYFNEWKAIEPGMYLIELYEPDAAMEQEREDCEAYGYPLAVQWYNEQHGTSFEDYESLFVADLTDDQLNEVERAFVRYASEVKCPISRGERLVLNADSRPIEIFIGKPTVGGP